MYSTTGLTQAQVVELCVRVNAAASAGEPVSWPPVLGLFKSIVVTLTYLRRNGCKPRSGRRTGSPNPPSVGP